jgi:G6PDH family F420-dependent oxidoreductase
VPLVGYHLSSEEHPPDALVRNAHMAEHAGFGFLGISDHFHPWTDAQGQSPFVWNVLGAIAQVTRRIPVGTAVTCPTVRIHPAIIAQAAATTAAMLPGRFYFGVGTGERLNEHVLGDPWPPTEIRREMLEEAIGLMRELWRGEAVTRRGRHYTVENARIYTRPTEPPPIVISGFGPHATELAGRVGDGYMNVAPDRDLVEVFRRAGGEGKPCYGKLDVCWAPTEEEARRIAYESWPTSAVPGELGQELPMPAHFEQAASTVTEDDVADAILCSPDPERHLEAIREFEAAGYDHVLVQQCGPDQAGFLDVYARDVLPRL